MSSAYSIEGVHLKEEVGSPVVLYVYWLTRGSFFCSVFPDCKIYYTNTIHLSKSNAQKAGKNK